MRPLTCGCEQAEAAVEAHAQRVCTAWAAHILHTVAALLKPFGTSSHSGSGSGSTVATSTPEEIAASVSTQRITLRRTLLAGGHTAVTCASLKTFFDVLLGTCDAGAMLGLPAAMHPRAASVSALQAHVAPALRRWPQDLAKAFLEQLLGALPGVSRSSVLSASRLVTEANADQTAPLSERCIFATVVLEELAGAIGSIVDADTVASVASSARRHPARPQAAKRRRGRCCGARCSLYCTT